MSAGDPAKLPRWARDELLRLREANAQLRQREADAISAQPQPGDHGNVWLRDPRSGHGGYMPSRFRDARFMLGGDPTQFLDFRANSNYGHEVYVCAGTTLHVYPHASNVVRLGLGR